MKLTKTQLREIIREEIQSLNEKSKLRSVRVTYDNGDVISTSMAAHLSDKQIKDYFKKGKQFNIGSGGKDKMAKVKDVEILENINEAGNVHTAGTKVKVPYRGKVVSGTVVRYIPPTKVSSPMYVVDVGAYASETVPAHDVKI